MSDQKPKRELLKDKVVDLVKMFIKAEGGMAMCDIDYAIEQVAVALHTSQKIILDDL